MKPIKNIDLVTEFLYQEERKYYNVCLTYAALALQHGLFYEGENIEQMFKDAATQIKSRKEK